MTPFSQMLLLTTAAGACIVLGGLLARIEAILPRWLEAEFRHSVIAFGGGVLVAAVALVLVPEGVAHAGSATSASLTFLAGGVAFCVLERYLALSGADRPQLSAMLLDYLPESLALGGLFAVQSSAAPMLALLIGLQNLPEGFNASREVADQGNVRTWKSLARMALFVPLGPLFGALGWHFGPPYPAVLGGVMLFAAGGILYLIFQDIAPQARLDRHWSPTLGAVLGFSLGMLGDLLVAA